MTTPRLASLPSRPRAPFSLAALELFNLDVDIIIGWLDTVFAEIDTGGRCDYLLRGRDTSKPSWQSLSALFAILRATGFYLPMLSK